MFHAIIVNAPLFPMPEHSNASTLSGKVLQLESGSNCDEGCSRYLGLENSNRGNRIRFRR
jgi:hypothetical protein